LTTGPKWLDLTYHRDRMGYVTKHTYNALRQRTSTTNPRNFTTIFAYCPCGTLESIDDPAPEGGLTEFFYDFNGRRTTVIFPDNTFINYNYDRAGQLIEAQDALGLWTLDYNIQGLLTDVDSPAGPVLSVEYDIDDHPVAVTDANDVTRAQTFDRLGRLLTRSWPDTGVEILDWSARGLTGYTDQEGKAAAYAYDQASRRISHTTPNTEILNYTYNAAGDLLTLTD
jgi:YD repeat-containing protein